MKILEIIIDGFKSYGNRTELKDFDPQFNALTGENGTGKSNVLEAIFFVLGCSLRKGKLARVQDPKDLIYKKGQGQVKKASVSIKFCNKNQAQSPMGYENQHIIIIERILNQDGSNKFKVNNKKKQNKEIREMFKQIRLNVDNFSTFFVQQGKVAEIVKFQPKELMSFVEEAAGVSLYNQIRDSTVNNLQKNEPILSSLDNTVAEIKKEYEKKNQEYDDFKKFDDLKQNLNKIKHQLEYYQQQQGKQVKVQLEKELKQIEKNIKSLSKEIDQNLTRINDLSLKKNNLPQNNSQNIKQQEIKTEIQNLQNNIKELKLEEQGSNEELEKYEQKLIKIQNNKEQREKIHQENLQREKELKLLIKDTKLKIENIQIQQQDFKVQQNEKKQKDFLMQQIEEYQKKHQKLEEKLRNNKIDQEKNQYEIQDQQSKLQDDQKKYKDYEQNIMSRKQKFQKIEQHLLKFESIYKEFESKKKDQEHLEQQLKKIIQNKENQFGKFPRFDIENEDRIRDIYNEQEFYGKVYQFFQVKDEQFEIPLDKIAGKKLFFYVVKDDHIVTSINSKNLFQYDCDIIPNNTIRIRQINMNKITLAKEIAGKMGEKVWLPHEVIEYNENLQKTISYVFENCFICSSDKLAQALCFDQNIRIRCVTLQGDFYNPSGVLQGGYVKQNENMIKKGRMMQELIQQINEIKNRISEINKYLEKFNNDKEEIRKLENQKQELKYEIQDYEQKMKNINLKQLMHSIEQQKKNLIFLQEQEERLKQEYFQSEKQTKAFTNQLTSNKTNISKFILNQIEENQKLKQQLENESQLYDQEYKNLLMEIENYQKESTIQSNIQNIKECIEQKKNEIQQILTRKFQTEQNILDKKESLNKLIKYLKKQEDQINSLQNQIDDAQKQQNENQEEIQKLKTLKKDKFQRLQEINESLKHSINNIIEQNNNNENFEEQIQILKNQQKNQEKDFENLKKRINPQAQEDFQKFDKQFKKIQFKKEEVNQNYHVLKNDITEMDLKKQLEVETCFNKVNKNLEQIFSKLLPGAKAQMEIREYKEKNQTQKGIVIKIALGNQWKNSLSELSGGQRTLLALSFLLSLLKYNSAPFYIFDEVDAALDLSHTENLGSILSTHFSESQFFIISLKQGFYKNANVLFRTAQENGRSKIQRINLKEKRVQNATVEFQQFYIIYYQEFSFYYSLSFSRVTISSFKLESYNLSKICLTTIINDTNENKFIGTLIQSSYSQLKPLFFTISYNSKIKYIDIKIIEIK